MRKILLLVGFYCVGQISLAQSIKGHVYLSEERTPVQYGSVVLMKHDSTYVAGGITYSGGEYTFNNVIPGKYLVKGTHLGFQDKVTNITVNKGQNTVMADTLFLPKDTKAIEEVEVTADYIRGKELVDRTVYTIPPELAKSSTDGYEVLRKLPSVQVDFNNNITLNGNSNFIIQIDGKQRNKEFLARLTPDDIKSVEIIHNPSGKYDGTVDGVINVVLREGARKGIGGNVSAVVKPFNKPFMFGNAGLDYGREKVTYYVSGYVFNQSLNNFTSNQYQFKGEAFSDSLINNTGIGDFSITSAALNTGFDYYIDKKNTFSFNYSLKPSTMSTDLENISDISLNANSLYEQKYVNFSNPKSVENNASVYYKRKFEKPIQELTFETTLYWFNSDEKNTFDSRLYPLALPEQITTSAYTENVSNNRNYSKTKIDYVHPLGVSMRLETGYQLYYQKMAFNTQRTDFQDNVFNYSETRNAAYLSWMWNVKKFGVSATLRQEYSDLLINDSTSSKYFTFLPSTNFQYKISGKQNLKFTYNRRIRRPNIYQLNPFVKLNSNQFISSGNPYLQPELRDKLQLTYSINFKKNFISPYLYYNRISEKIGSINRVDEFQGKGPIIRTSPENVLTGHEQGVGLNSMLWFVKLDGRLYKGRFDAYSNGITQIDAWDYISHRLTSYVFAPVIKDTLTVFAFFIHNGIRYSAQSKTYSDPIYGLGGQYKYKGHTFSINYVFPFAKTFNYRRVVTETNSLYSESVNSFDVKHFVQFVYNYKFNKGKGIKKSGHKSKIESDTQGGGIGR